MRGVNLSVNAFRIPARLWQSVLWLKLCNERDYEVSTSLVIHCIMRYNSVCTLLALTSNCPGLHSNSHSKNAGFSCNLIHRITSYKVSYDPMILFTTPNILIFYPLSTFRDQLRLLVGTAVRILYHIHWKVLNIEATAHSLK